MKIEANKVGVIHYTLTNVDNEVLDSSEGKDPLAYIHGIGNLIPGLEDQLLGKEAGAEFKAEIAPENGYGLFHEELIQKLPKENFGDHEVELGMQFEADSPEGTQIFTVTAIEDDGITVDGNHELAGETLTFDIKIVEVREASEKELEHGHAHGAGGHDH